MTGEANQSPGLCEIELDIFSGMPNPTWILTNAEADRFEKQLAALARTPARELSGKLGYRGFIVQCTRANNVQLIRIHNGAIHISKGETNVYANDEERELERWLLNTGRPHLKSEIFQIAERDFR